MSTERGFCSECQDVGPTPELNGTEVPMREKTPVDPDPGRPYKGSRDRVDDSGASLSIPVMRTSMSPDAGDVIVRRNERGGACPYVLRTSSGSDQYLLRTRGDAVGQAVRFAAAHSRLGPEEPERHFLLTLGMNLDLDGMSARNIPDVIATKNGI